MTTSPDVSVVIAYFKNEATLPAQLDAFVAQESAPAFEVLLADNEGSEALRAVAADFAGRLDIRVVSATGRRGQAYARNVGIEYARAEIVGLCDGDDVVGPGWVRAAFDTLNDHDALATGPLRLDRLNPEFTWRTYLGIDSVAVVAPPVVQEPFVFLDYERFAIGCNMAVRRGTLRDVGGFDESLLGGTEDVELSWKLIERGCPLEFAPDMLVDYRLRTTERQVFRQRRGYARSQLRMWSKSRQAGRPVRGMSMRWAVTSVAGLPIGWVRTRRGTHAERFEFAATAGAVLGNFEGQVAERIIRRRW
ncbi:glycosyltransferase family 2 protein [Calidifontibacter terrae]